MAEINKSLFAVIGGETPEQKQWKEDARADGRVKAVIYKYKCPCGKEKGTYAKSVKMEAGEGIGTSAFYICTDCKCYACGAENPEIKTN